MSIHTIVYVVLTVLAAMAAYASSMPIYKAPRGQHAPDAEQEMIDPLQP